LGGDGFGSDMTSNQTSARTIRDFRQMCDGDLVTITSRWACPKCDGARATAAPSCGRGWKMAQPGAEQKNDTKQEGKMPSDQIP